MKLTWTMFLIITLRVFQCCASTPSRQVSSNWQRRIIYEVQELDRYQETIQKKRREQEVTNRVPFLILVCCSEEAVNKESKQKSVVIHAARNQVEKLQTQNDAALHASYSDEKIQDPVLLEEYRILDKIYEWRKMKEKFEDFKDAMQRRQAIQDEL